MEYLNILDSWCLTLYKQRFIDEGITDDSFSLIDDTTVDILFDKAGPKLVFKKKFREYSMDNNRQNNNNSQQSNFEDIELNPTSESSFTNTISTISLNQPTSSVSSDTLTFVPDEELFSLIQNSPSNNNSSTPNKKSKMMHSVLSTTSLENLLDKSTDGRLLLLNKYKLCNDLRQKLCKIVISDLLSQGTYEIKKETFVQVTKEIGELFPGEEAQTYYIPYSSSKVGLRTPARGKLWAKYLNIKAALRAAKQSLQQQDTLDESNDLENQFESADIDSELLFLRTAIEPQSRIVIAWEKTFKKRFKLYFNGNKEDNLLDIFPCLRCPFGLTLLEIDFNHMHPEKIDVIYETWQKVTDAILKEGCERKISKPKSKGDVENLPSNVFHSWLFHLMKKFLFIMKICLN